MVAFLLCFLPVFISSAAVTGAEKVITASRGETVLLPCPLPFESNELVHVDWKKDGESSFCKYTINNTDTVNLNCNSHSKVNADTAGLLITDVTSSDAGVYNCTMFRVIPPPSVEKFTILILQVKVPPGLTVQQVNSSNLTCVELLCSLEGLSPEQVNFTWTRNSEQLPHQNDPSNMSSTLKLCKPHWRDGDTVTCRASYSSNHTLYSKNITLKCSNNECSETGGVSWLLIGSVVGACVGLLFIIICAAFFKCKKKDDSDSIVFSNKIYENLSFFSSRPTPEPSAELNTRTQPRPNPQGECQTQKEECIYEN